MIELNLASTLATAKPNVPNAMGFRLDEIHGKHHGMFVSPELRERAEYREFRDALHRDGDQAAEYKCIGKRGKAIWIQASCNPISGTDGKLAKVVKFATDTTAQAEDRLRRGEMQKFIEFDPGEIIDADFIQHAGRGARRNRHQCEHERHRGCDAICR